MKYVKWKSLLLTAAICLVPILLGLSLWNELPATLAIHFDLYNNPDNFAPKGFVVFGLPLFMALMQCVCCLVSDISSQKRGMHLNTKLERVCKWTIPAITIILQIITLGYGLGWKIDIRKVAMLLVSIMLLVTGNYLPKLGYVKNFKATKEQARKINRLGGFLTVIMGILFLISILLPPVASVFCLLLFVPYTVILILYGIKITRKQ